MLFRMGKPTHFVPLGMTEIRVFCSIVPQSRMGTRSAQGGQGSQKCPLGSSTPKPQTGGHSEPVRTTSSIPSRTVSSAAPAPGSPGIPEDFEVLQPQTRASKKRRLSDGQGTDEQLEPNAALGHIKSLVMVNIRDRIAFYRITEEFCQLEKLHLMEVVTVADRAYSKALKDFPSLLTQGSITVALVDTLAKAHDEHTLAVLKGLEESHKSWVKLKKDQSNAEIGLSASNSHLFNHLLSEAVNLSPAAFTNVLNLSVGLLPQVQHTMPPIQPRVVLTTQVPILGVIPSMGVSIGAPDGDDDSNNGDGGDGGGDQLNDDKLQEDGGALDTGPKEGPGGDGLDNQKGDDDIIHILQGSPPCKVVKCSCTPLSTGGRNVDMDASVVGTTNDGLAISPPGMVLGEDDGSQLLPSSDTLKLSPLMSAAAAQALIKSTHQLIDHPPRSPKKVVETSDDEGTFKCTASFKNEGQVTFHPEDNGKEDDVDSLIDPGDPATQAQMAAAVTKIRPSVWAEDAADVKMIKQRQTSMGHVSDKLMFCTLIPKLLLEDILGLIMSKLSTDVFIDCCTTAEYKPDLSINYVRHMYTKFRFAYVICLCCMTVDFFTPQLFVGVPTPHTLKKHTIPGEMAKPRGDKAKEYRTVLCNFCPFFSSNEDSAYSHICHLHLCMAIGCSHCFDYMSFSHADLRDHFKSCTVEGFDSGLATNLD